ncbi:MAG: EAL domain-containing protein [Epsilonproteobacteria bacterium]|nr:EAL domain-containing protein [Campylobacterota bacterium]
MSEDFIENEVYLGRQPILNKQSEIVGYELLHRNSDIFNYYRGELGNFDSTIKTLSVALNNIGIDKLLDNKIGFVNVSEDLLYHNIIDNIPKEKIYLEILKSETISEKLFNRICELTDKGYTFVLDDFVFSTKNLKKYDSLFPKINYIKVDLQKNSLENMKKTVESLRKYDIKFIAEKVETHEDFEKLKDIGYDFFQGYYFAMPTILSTKKIDPLKPEILDILNSIQENENTQSIIRKIEKYPLICINLLKFINSAYFNFKQDITSIKQAVTLLGLNHLKNWLVLLLYSNDGENPYSNPLFVMIKNRSDFMLNILKYLKEHNDEYTKEIVYLTGLLSKIDIIFNAPLEKALKDLHISKNVQDAILHKKGIAGTLLSLAEANEADDRKSVKSILDKLSLQTKHLTNANLNSYLSSS